MKKFFNKAFLCFSLLLLSSVVYAQSNNVVKIPLEKKQQGEFGNNELPKRELGVCSILPIVLYNVTEGQMIIASHYVTFESVAFYIVDEFGLVQQQGEMTLRKGDEVELHLLLLPVGSYKILFDFYGDRYEGEFEVEK